MSENIYQTVRKAAAGDQNAITALYQLTYSSVYKTVRSMISDDDTALDIVQDSYIKGFQSLDQLDTPEHFGTWMKRIAVNKAKDYLKKKKPILFTDMANEDGDEIDFRDDCLDHCPEELLDRKETARLMQEILATLSDDQRLVIGMFYYEEMSVHEIAATLGCSENTVKSRLNYGRKKIEAKVLDLEKKGTKLYSLAPLPFLLWLFRMDAEAAEVPSAAVLQNITARCATGSALWGSGAGTAAVHAGAKAAAGAGAKTLAAKIMAGVLAVAVAGGGTVLALTSVNRSQAEPTEPRITAETTLSARQETVIPTTIPEIQETTVPVTDPAEAAAEAYGQVMQDLSQACSTDSTQWLVDPEAYHQQYSHLNTEQLDSYHMYEGTSFYFAYTDLDGNGIQELILSSFNQLEPRHSVIGIYTFDGAEAVEIIECGSNHIADVCANGHVILTEGTILDGTSYVCALGADGIYPEIIAQHTYDLYEDTYRSDNETLSSQEYYAKYVPNGYMTLDWYYLCG